MKEYERLYYVEKTFTNGKGSYELFKEEKEAKESFKVVLVESVEDFSVAELNYGEARVKFNGHGVNKEDIKNYDITEVINVERTVTFDNFEINSTME